MARWVVVLWCARLLVAVVLAGCHGEARDGFNESEWEAIESLTGAEPPAPCPDGLELAGDPDCEALAALGQSLFFEREFSGPLTVGDDGANGGLGAPGEFGAVACASCHAPPWFVDHRSRPNATSLGSAWGERNTPSIVNAVYYEQLTWSGKHDSLWELIGGPLENELFMNGDRLWLARVVYADYREPYEALFGPLDPALESADIYAERCKEEAEPQASPSLCAIADEVLANAGYAIEAYERRLISIDAPFDRWVRDPDAPFSDAARRGLALFIGPAACIECHNGPLLTDNRFYNTGVAQVGLYVPGTDEGRGELDPEQVGRFRTPSLRNVTESAPFMHTGGEATLEDVVWFYHLGGDASGFAGDKESFVVPLDLSDQEMADLVAFLRTLTGDPVNERLRCDTSDDGPPTCSE